MPIQYGFGKEDNNPTTSPSNSSAQAVLEQKPATETIQPAQSIAPVANPPATLPPSPEPVKPTAWAVTSTPVKAVPIETINTALAHYQAKGMTKQGAAYLVGNFIHESHLLPCAPNKGDGGLAWGLAQWHPGRRADMPCGFIEQLDWAVDVEMQRHTPALRTALFDPNTGTETIKALLFKWEVWGTLGGRWVYAQNIYNQILGA